MDRSFFISAANRMSRESLWTLVDQIEVIQSLYENELFRSHFKMEELERFESEAAPFSGYAVWGAGEDGRKIVRLLKLLKKPISFWCDKKLAGSLVDDEKIVSLEEGMSEFGNSILILGARKYEAEMLQQLQKEFPQQSARVLEGERQRSELPYYEEYCKKAVLSSPPRWLTIGVSSACNNKCLFCAYHGEDAKGNSNVYGIPHMLSLSDFKRIVDMAKEGEVPSIHICGTGEPFMNPHILEMMDYVIERYGKVSIQTNFAKSVFEKNHYLDEIIKRSESISHITTDVLSSSSEVHDFIKRGAKYSELLESLSYLTSEIFKRGGNQIYLKPSLILTKKNYENLEGILDDFLERNCHFELSIYNLFSYDYSEFTSSDNVYTSKDHEITKALKRLQAYGEQKGIAVRIPKPADQEHKCDVFWNTFQIWPVKGCDTDRYGENMVPHACAAVVKGGLNSLGYLFDYPDLMSAWNSETLVAIRENLLQNQYPSEHCRTCYAYQGEDSCYIRKAREQ